MVNSIRSGSRYRNICTVVFHNFSWIFGHATCLQYSFHKSSGADKKRTDGTSAQTICTTLKQMRTSLNHLLQVLRHVCYNVKTQQHSLQWKPKSFPKLKKSKTELIEREDHSVVLTVEIMCTMSSFLRVPDRLTASTKDSAQQRTGTLAWTQVVYAPQPSCRHSALCAEVSSANRTPVIPQLPYSSDLSPVGFSCSQNWQLI